jgi:hypothetical protein
MLRSNTIKRWSEPPRKTKVVEGADNLKASVEIPHCFDSSGKPASETSQGIGQE